MECPNPHCQYCRLTKTPKEITYELAKKEMDDIFYEKAWYLCPIDNSVKWNENGDPTIHFEHNGFTSGDLKEIIHELEKCNAAFVAKFS